MTRLRALALGSTALAFSLAIHAAGTAADIGAPATGIDKIQTVVVIYAENRAFDNLYGHFPGANGLDNASQESLQQRDRDGSVLKELPPV